MLPADICQCPETCLVVKMVEIGGGCAATGISWAEARGSTKHLTMQRTAPQKKNFISQNVSSAEGEKPC